MENDGFAYYGGGRYYSPIMGRMLSLQSPLSSSGGFNAGLSEAASAAIPGDPGSNAALQDSVRAFNDAAQLAAGFSNAFAGADSAVGALAASMAWAAPVALGAELLDQALNFFGVFDGGGGPPPWIIWKLTHRGGNLQVWAQIDGTDPAWAPSWAQTADVHLVAAHSNQPPLQKPQYSRPQSPEFRAAPAPPQLHLTFGQCEALLLVLTAKYTASCGVNAALCGSSVFGNPEGPASCAGALGPCSIVAAETALCYAQSRGFALPRAPHAP